RRSWPARRTHKLRYFPRHRAASTLSSLRTPWPRCRKPPPASDPLVFSFRDETARGLVHWRCQRQALGAACPARGRRWRTSPIGEQFAIFASCPGSPGEDYQALNRYLLMRRLRMRDSSVERGMPSLAAAPWGPDTRPWLSASALSISSLR